MEISAALAADLGVLSRALDQADTDIEHALEALADSVRQSVPSYLALCVTLVIDGLPITIRFPDGALPADVATSAVLALPAVSSAAHGSIVEFYAATAGAFTDFAADLSFALGLPMDAIRLDREPPAPSHADASIGVREMSLVNIAIGILIGRGYLPASARAELARLADVAKVTVVSAAKGVIGSTAHADRESSD
ncbi:hypothetical protein ACSMXN_09545 [Jatrophihabitans sp. DSM 45814]